MTSLKDKAYDIHEELVKKGYIKSGELTLEYHDAVAAGSFRLDCVSDEAISTIREALATVYQGYQVENANKKRIRLGDEVNQENYSKKAFQELWSQINRKNSYRVSFDDEELIEKAKEAINDKLTVSTPEYHMTQASAAQMTEDGFGFEVKEEGSATAKYRTPLSRVRYDLLGGYSC